jgi:predicted transcriptional regulator
MSLVHGAYNGRKEIVEDGTVLDKNERAWLITDVDCSETVQITSIDLEPARFRMHGEVIDGNKQYIDMTFDLLSQARLAYGLWNTYGPFSEPEGDAVPVEVAIGGQEAVAGYLLINGGYPRSCTRVAEKMDVDEDTVLNWCSHVCWEPSRDQMHEQVIEAVHSTDGEFTISELLQTVDASYEMIQTVLAEMSQSNVAEEVNEYYNRWRVTD